VSGGMHSTGMEALKQATRRKLIQTCGRAQSGEIGMNLRTHHEETRRRMRIQTRGRAQSGEIGMNLRTHQEGTRVRGGIASGIASGMEIDRLVDTAGASGTMIRGPRRGKRNGYGLTQKGGYTRIYIIKIPTKMDGIIIIIIIKIDSVHFFAPRFFFAYVSRKEGKCV